MSTTVLELTAAPTVGGVTPPDPAAENNNQYVLRVRAEDPSTASAVVYVIVTVTPVNEAPKFPDDAPTVLRVAENQAETILINATGTTALDAGATGDYAVTDIDADNDTTDGATTVAYRVEGADAKYFSIDATNAGV